MNIRAVAKFARLFVGLLVAVACLPVLTNSDEPAKGVKSAGDSMLGTEAGDVRDDNGLTMKLVWCPAGAFMMGGEEYRRPSGVVDRVTPVNVFLSRGYWIGKYEATQAEWRQVMRTEPWKGQMNTQEGDDYPASCLSWDNAMEFCARLTKSERDAGRLAAGWEYTLPTEAQWERACRARTETRFHFGSDESNVGEHAWFVSNTTRVGEPYAHQVGRKKPNPWGLHDMHGNVWEFCRDGYATELPGGRDPEVILQVDPNLAGRAVYSRVNRGGSWGNRGDRCDSTSRGGPPTDLWNYDMGFRVVLTPVRPAK